MTRKAVFFACTLVLALGASAQADPYITTNATLNLPTLAGIGSVIHVDAGNNVGVSYTNAFSPGPVTVGTKLVAVGSALLGQYTVGPPPGTAANFNVANHNIVGTFSLLGSATSIAGAQFTGTFTQGTLRIFDTGSTLWAANNPNTWTSATQLAEYRLAFQASGVHEDVVSGPTTGALFGSQIVQPGQAQDTAVANTATPFDSNYNILFNLVNGNFLVNTPAPNTLFNGLFINGTERILNPTTGGDNGLGASGIQVLNNIALSMIATAFTDNTPGGNFAPGNVTLASFNGDTSQGLGATLYPVFQPFTPIPPSVIPEPASMALWGVLAAGFGVWGGVRRFRQS